MTAMPAPLDVETAPAKLTLSLRITGVRADGYHLVDAEMVSLDLADTLKGFKGLVEGKYDHLPEAAFYMVGNIEEAIEKGKKLAAEAA